MSGTEEVLTLIEHLTGLPVSLSGGELYFYPRFDPMRDAPCLASHFRRLISRTTVYSCSMRVRCSVGRPICSSTCGLAHSSDTGLRVAKQYGNFYESAAADLEFGIIDADKTMTVALEHARTLDDRQYAFIQSAILYTTREGERRVRVHNLALRVVTLAGNVFQYADMDAAVSFLVREGQHCT